MLRIDPAAQDGARMRLTALPAGYVPASDGIRGMPLSPDGTQLAADLGPDPPFTQALYVFDLATGTDGPGALSPLRLLPARRRRHLSPARWKPTHCPGPQTVSTCALVWVEQVSRLLNTRAAGYDIA